MSTLSPTFTWLSILVSCTFELYFQLLGPENVMDGIFESIAVMVAVIVRCVAPVTPGLAPDEGVTAADDESTGFSPGRCTRRTMFS